MKNLSFTNTFRQCLFIGAVVLMGCNGKDSIPASNVDKITSLVVQAESDTYNTPSAVDLTHQQILIENLALSADYFVDETHFNPSLSEKPDSFTIMEPWKTRCKNDKLKSPGFGQCLANLELSAQEKESLVSLLREYHRVQLPLLRNQFEIIERLNDSVEERIELAVEELNAGNEPLDSFQLKIQSIEKWFCESLHKEQLVSKTAIRLSVNYRNTLEAIEQLLSEKQFRNFYICHKR
jgi:hypothetical protein